MLIGMFKLGTTKAKSAVWSPWGSRSKIGAVPSRPEASETVISPAWEFEGHWSRAKSAEVQWVIAKGLPKRPSGALKITFWATSGAPGLWRVKEVVKSG